MSLTSGREMKGRTMTRDSRQCRRRLGSGTIIVMLIAGFGIANAASLHVRESSPATETIIRGHHAEYVIRFDGPVDHETARMDIMQGGRIVRTLTPLGDSAPDVLFAAGETPAPGHYTLHWRVCSPEDGAVSEGGIPFSVENKDRGP
jgi:methionine-rich copper-binding protein CopC